MKQRNLKKNLLTENLKLVKEWHPTKNGKLTPDMFNLGSGKKIWWICEQGHEWKTAIYRRSNGSKCPYCLNQKILKGYNDLTTVNPELAKEWHPIKNGFLKPDMVGAGSRKKVWWICENGHEWEASIDTRKKGHACKICSLKTKGENRTRNNLKRSGSLQETNPKLAKEWHPIKNGDLKPTEIIASSGRKVWWLGVCGHEWEAQVCSRNKGNGCQICDKEIKTSFPEQAIYFYLNKSFKDVINSYKVLGQTEIDVFIKSLNLGIEYDGDSWHKDIEKDKRKNLLCKEKGINLIRIREKNCPLLDDNTFCIILKDKSIKELEKAIREIYAYINNNIKKHNYILDININRDTSVINNLFIIKKRNSSLLKLNPELAKEWHPTKNGKITPDMVTSSSNRKVWWLGKCGHEWQSVIASRTKGNGCLFCASKKTLKGFNDLATRNPKLIKEWHPTKNENITPDMVTSSSNRKVWWLGKCGHEWLSSINSRNKGVGCPYCANQKILLGYNDLGTQNPELAKEWNLIKNGDLKPTNVIAGSNKKVWWECNKGHEWQANIASRNTGTNCPYCVRERRKKRK